MKMKKSTIIIIVIVAVVLILAIAVIGMYNGLVQRREAVATARSTIDTTLQRRADLVPQLVASVKNLTEHEQSIVDAVTDARAAMVGATDTAGKLEANEKLNEAVNNLMVVVEAYPEIASSSAYTTLMDELSGTENRIAVARRDYNTAVEAYNKKVVSFPNNLLAGMFGFEKEPYFEASANATQVPNVGELFG